ncbi:MAG: hypothetical protein ACE37F_33965 [Nannocystaceae bacterium]|nr:hypothetical protein [bacterium]
MLCATLGTVVVAACDDDADAEGEVVHTEVAASTSATPDGTLKTHEIVPSTPSAEGLAYLRAVAAIQREADDQRGAAAVATLQRGLDLEVPAGLPEAEIVQLELASRIAGLLIESDAAAEAKELLVPMLEPSRSVPLDRASAEALIMLGDAATRTGDDALAAGTYARSIRMMSILRQELER